MPHIFLVLSIVWAGIFSICAYLLVIRQRAIRKVRQPADVCVSDDVQIAGGAFDWSGTFPRRSLLQTYNNGVDCMRGYFVQLDGGAANGYCLSQNDAFGSDITIAPCANTTSQVTQSEDGGSCSRVHAP